MGASELLIRPAFLTDLADVVAVHTRARTAYYRAGGLTEAQIDTPDWATQRRAGWARAIESADERVLCVLAAGVVVGVAAMCPIPADPRDRAPGDRDAVIAELRQIHPEEMLAGWEQRVEQQTSRTTELSRQLEHARTSSESRGGEVVVTVDSAGALAELSLSDRAMRMPAGELAELILDTNRRAQARLAQQMVEIVTGLYGAGSETAAFIGGVYTEKFPEPPVTDEEDDRR